MRYYYMTVKWQEAKTNKHLTLPSAMRIQNNWNSYVLLMWVKMIQLLWKNFPVSYKLKHTLTTGISKPAPKYLFKTNKNGHSIGCIWLVLATLLIIAKNKKQPKCSLTCDSINKYGISTNRILLSNDKEWTNCW